MFIKISHKRLKNCQNVAKMLCGTPKTRHFSAFLSHFSKIIFEKRLIRQSQRFALLAAELRSCPKKHTTRRPLHAVLARFRVVRLVMQNQKTSLINIFAITECRLCI